MAVGPMLIGLVALALIAIRQSHFHEFARLRNTPPEERESWILLVSWSTYYCVCALPIALVVSLMSFVVYPAGYSARYIPDGPGTPRRYLLLARMLSVFAAGGLFMTILFAAMGGNVFAIR